MRAAKPDYRILILCGLGLASVAVAIMSLVLLFASLSPRQSSGLAKVLPLAETHALAAEAAMRARDWSTAKAETRAELRVSPVRDDAWLRLAEIDVSQHGRLGPEGVAALSHAYDAVPYDLTAASRRRRFVRIHEVELPQGLHAQVEEEMSAEKP